MPPTQYRPSRRNWVKLWVNEWLTGTVRFEMSPAQRGMWADLLALGGASRHPGFIAAGETNGKLYGYPADYLCGIFRCNEKFLQETLKLFEAQDRIKTRKGVIEILNWAKYQSEYHQKRQRKSAKRAGQVVENSGQSNGHLRDNVEREGEGEVEVDGEVEAEGDAAAKAASPPPPQSEIFRAFEAMKSQPFGPKRFQEIWYEEWIKPGDESFADAMESCIQRCKTLRITIPGKFYELKREVERTEAANAGHEMRKRHLL
jgi:N-terminal phage replisome organiser (Phage_rep_org_N)